MLAPQLDLGLISKVLLQYSWWLALRKGFRYDYEQRQAKLVGIGRGARTSTQANDAPPLTVGTPPPPLIFFIMHFRHHHISLI